MKIESVTSGGGKTVIQGIGGGDFFPVGTVLTITIDHETGTASCECNHCHHCRQPICEHKRNLCPVCGDRLGLVIASILRAHFALARTARITISHEVEDEYCPGAPREIPFEERTPR